MRQVIIGQSEVHSAYNLSAFLKDDGISGYLYIYEMKKRKREVSFAWVYNRIEAPSARKATSIGVLQRWPAPSDITLPTARCDNPEECTWTFIWDKGGCAMALAKDGLLVAFTDLRRGVHYNRNLIKSSWWGWGEPWPEDSYREVLKAIHPPNAVNRRSGTLRNKYQSASHCTLNLPPVEIPVSNIKFGRAKHFDKITLKHVIQYPIWVSAHDERHDEEYEKPIVNTDDVTEDVDQYAPIITFKVKGTDLFGSGWYSHSDGHMYALSLWYGGKWASLGDCEQLEFPIELIAVPKIRGQEHVEFCCNDPHEDRAYRKGMD
jgi:hypothetical protein